jgi:choline dehydrogenase-like flavoprotein
MYGSGRAFEAAQRKGYKAFPFPAGILSEDYQGRHGCKNCGFCGNYGCAINAKSSPAVTTLRQALLTGNCLLMSQTRTVRLEFNGARNSITGVYVIPPEGCSPDKCPVYRADAYVLAASPIESARLLFLSDPSGQLGNSSGQVGQNLMFHYQTVVAGVFDERLHPYRAVASRMAWLISGAIRTTGIIAPWADWSSSEFLSSRSPKRRFTWSGCEFGERNCGS